MTDKRQKRYVLPPYCGDDIAKYLGVSYRTFMRILKREGVNHRNFLFNELMDFVIRNMKEPKKE